MKPNFLLIQKIISFEPVSTAELLTFISSIILLIITWKSVSNAKKSNKITLKSLEISKETLELQKQQFNENIKPILVTHFPSVIIDELSYYKAKSIPDSVSKLLGDYRFHIKNTSKNIAYNVNIYTYLYLENKSWIKYNEENYQYNTLPPISTNNSTFHLNSDEKLKNTIPYHYFKGAIQNFNPDIYILISYENKVGITYEEGYKLKKIGKVFGQSYTTKTFEPMNTDVPKLKKNILKQKNFLEKHLKKDLSYYFIP
ncbi:hypothetical protein [Salimicrobium jeotgali]|uniref:hypothetical protein n=1 Tax=Salimicrobium jeotgali TaxID=1230341 RepID=UPI000C859AB3|nr:hypothetical protein [Salimicrobium jeotgali]